MSKRIVTIVCRVGISCVIFCIAGCGVSARKIAVPDNSRVHWDGDFGGLTPEIASSETQEIRADPARAKVALLDALSNPNRFVTAHVLLTKLFADRYLRNARTWNGLHVNMLSEDTVEYDMADVPKLARQWREKLWGGNHSLVESDAAPDFARRHQRMPFEDIPGAIPKS